MISQYFILCRAWLLSVGQPWLKPYRLFGAGDSQRFLEARIIPERIEHRIEPERRGSEPRSCPKKFALLFRRERRDDFFEARIAAERVPEQMQL
jgi:hypothetical protein